MDNFQKKFIEEATDLIDTLEDVLLQLEADVNNQSLTAEVFRVMHSLKGGGAMFGFTKISEFTHNLESIYDYVRNGEVELNKELLDVTLASVDHIKYLIDNPEMDDDEGKKVHSRLTNQILQIIKKIENKDFTEENVSDNGIVEVNNSNKTFYVRFTPHEEIFDNGTNPLYLVEELIGLGNGVSYVHKGNLPSLNEINPEKSYLSWEIIISAECGENDLMDVFIFVEDECDIEIKLLSEDNELNNFEFINTLNSEYVFNNDFGFDKVSSILSKYVKKSEIKSLEVASLDVKSELENKKTSSISKNLKRESQITSIRVSSDKIDEMMNLVSELVTTQARLSLYAEKNDDSELIAVAENVQKLSRQLRDNAFSISLIPIQNILTRFQRLVRDLSSEMKKQISFDATGTETELDKTIIDSLTEPLMHILRNSIDHGIEDEKTRLANGKPAEGKIHLKAFYSGTNVHIQISDDGGGINTEKVREKAISKGLISPDTNLTKKEMLDLIFLPGFSTAATVTDVSGRGVGMDVVKRKITDIRGEVELDSELGVGTTITIKLPLTLSIIDGLLVKIKDTHYVMPLSVVEKCYPVLKKEIDTTYNHLIVLDGQQVPFHYLRRDFDIESDAPNQMQMVVVNFEDNKVGLTVDTIIGEYQAVLKPLGRIYKGQDLISGATILGDGTIALVMDTNKIINEFSKSRINTDSL